MQIGMTEQRTKKIYWALAYAYNKFLTSSKTIKIR